MSSGLRRRMYSWSSEHLHIADSSDIASYRVIRGVPQGGVLNPTRLNITAIAMVKCIAQFTKIFVYADDISIMSAPHNRRVLCPRLQREIYFIEMLLLPRGLEISAGKCTAIACMQRDI